jgi:hypothetical protein
VIKLLTTPQIIFPFGLKVTIKLYVKDMKYKMWCYWEQLGEHAGNFIFKPLGTLGE